MNNFPRASGIVLLIGLCWASRARGQVPAPVQTGATGTPAILRDVGIDTHVGADVPRDLVFRDEAGNAVRLGDYFDKRPVVLVLAYYRCPMLCTMVLNDLTKSMNSLPQSCGEDFDVVTVSFDPRETPALAAEKKETYIRAYRRPHAEQGWHFLTGPPDSIEKLTRAVGFRYAWDARQQQFAHASGIMVLTPQGKISRYFFGIDYAPTDLRLALLDAGEKKISPSTSDRILLYCFHYDPRSGKYGLMVMRMLQTGGALTLLLLGGSIALTMLRDRRRSAAAGAFPVSSKRPKVPGEH